MSVSLWQRAQSQELSREHASAGESAGGSARGESVTCDVAVIGAGITGVSAALELERRGLRVVIVEAGRLAHGASGRNAGFLMRGAADNYAAAVREWGPDKAAMLWRWTEDNLNALRAEGIESLSTFEPRPSCLVAIEPDEEHELGESAELLERDGFAVRLVEPGDDAHTPRDAIWRRASPRVGLLNPADAVVSPVQMLAWLRGKLSTTRLVEGVEIDRIERTAGRLWCLRGGGAESDLREIFAPRVFVATNAWAGVLLPGVRVEPNRGQMLAARPADPRDAQLACAYYLNHGAEYVRRGPRGWGEDLVVFGGARKHDEIAERSHGQEPTEKIQSRLEELLRRWVCDEYEVVARWAGTMGFGPGGLPTVVRTDESDDPESGVWFCGGFTGHGMSMAFTTARAAVGAMLDGKATPFGP